MDRNKAIIIILLVIIVILVAILGLIFSQPTDAKESSMLKITSNGTLYEGDNVSVKLTDLNKTPMPKEKINITITDSKGKTVLNKTVETNSEGKAILNLDLKKGKYTVNASFGGNENYTGNNTTQKLTIKEEEIVEEHVTQQPTQSSSSSNDGLYYDEELNVYYNSEGVTVDPDGEHWHGAGNNYADLREARDRWSVVNR